MNRKHFLKIIPTILSGLVSYNMYSESKKIPLYETHITGYPDIDILKMEQITKYEVGQELDFINSKLRCKIIYCQQIGWVY